MQEDGSTTENKLQTSLLLNKCTGRQADIERVSTGTKHALHEWLKVTSALKYNTSFTNKSK